MVKMSIITNIRRFFGKNSICLASKHNLESILKCSTSAILHYDRDPGPLFTSEEVQNLLKSMTRIQVEKVFRKRSVPDNTIEYKFMTTEQLEKEYEKISKKAESQLQMPPVVKIKGEEQKIICKDPALKGFSSTPYVITDITYGLNQTDRKAVIRQTDGTLEYAPQAVHKRMNQLYFPLQGRKIRTPPMFEPEHLKRCLNEFKYEFILDRLCIQFEPYEKDFHEISSKVYQHINESKKFNDLRSTRHFGPMTFFLAWHKMIDDLLCDMIKRDFLKNGVELICLMNQLNNVEYDKSIHEKIAYVPPSEEILKTLKKSITSTPDDIHEEIKSAIGKSREDFEQDEICLQFMKEYVKDRALKKVPLEMAIQTFQESNQEKQKLYEGLRKAHGVN